MSEFIQEALNLLQNGEESDKITALLDLSSFFFEISIDQFNSIGYENIISPIVNLFKTTESEIALVMSSQCLRNLLSITYDVVGYIVGSGFIEEAVKKMTTLFNIDLAENCIYCFCSIAEYSTREIVRRMNLDIFFQFIDFFKIAEQRTCLLAVSVITQNCSDSRFVEFLPRISSILKSDDQRLATYAVYSLSNIVNSMDLSAFQDECYESISCALLVTSNIKVILNTLDSLITLTNITENCDKIIKSNIPFEKLLFSKDYADSKFDVNNRTLTLISKLLPSLTFPGNVFNPHGTPSQSLEFSRQIRNLIQRHIIENNTHEIISVYILSSCLSIEQFEIETNIFFTIRGYASKNEILPFILEFCRQLKNKTQLVVCDVLGQLSIAIKNMKGSDNQTYGKILEDIEKEANVSQANIFEGKTFSSLAELVNFVNTNTFSSAEFLSAKVAKQFHLLAKDAFREDAKDLDFTKLKHIFEDFTSFLPLSKQKDRFQGQSLDQLAGESFHIKVKYNDSTWNPPSLLMTSTFITVEFWLNSELNNISTSEILDAANNIPNLSKHLALDHIDKLSYTQLGILCRAFNVPNYKRLVFYYKDTKFHVYDSLFVVLARFSSNLDEVFNGRIIVEAKDEQEEDKLINSTPFMIKHEFITGDFRQILNCLKDIHYLQPDFPIYSEQLEKRCFSMMQSPVMNTTFYSPAMAICKIAPFLFSPQLRYFAFRMASFDFYSVLCYSQKVIAHNNNKFKAGRKYFDIHLKREEIPEVGKIIFDNFGVGPCELLITFEGEPGFGSGPFFELMSIMVEEYCKNSTKLFRNTGDHEYAFTEKGLFPRPDANKSLFFTLGVLCGKSVASDTVLPLPFSKAFIKLVMGQSITLEEVDEQISKSLKVKEALYGLDFTYPGIETLELIQSGKDTEVTEQNVDQYIKLVEEFTISGNVKECANEFRRGFSSVIPSPAFEMITPEDLMRLISGDDVEISYDDLFSGIDFGSGYSATSPQITMLFDAITSLSADEKSLFVKFITGCDKLPIGGIKSLHPRITIAKRTVEGMSPDQALPTVATCTHYLKIPPYSSAEIMKSKLLFAIHEGQKSFSFT